jgi:YegS/Rv2252/BmrU family lipid kinase
VHLSPSSLFGAVVGELCTATVRFSPRLANSGGDGEKCTPASPPCPPFADPVPRRTALSAPAHAARTSLPGLDRAVRLIVNPSAGGGRAARLLPAVEAALRGHGIVFRVDRTTSIEHARELARAARAAGEVAAAMGGDGLTGAVAGELRGAAVPLAVVPGGRGNDFARKLGIGTDPVAACDLIAAGRERRVDLAAAEDRVYVGILSAGLDSDVQDLAGRTRLPLGGFVYLYGTLRAVARWQPAGFTVTVDGAERSFSGYSVAVSNSGVFGGGMWLVPDAQVDDGLLDVVLTHDRPRTEFLRGLGKVFKGTHVDEPGFELLRGREVRISADRPFRAYADGDPVAPLPATVRVLPGALRVIAP